MCVVLGVCVCVCVCEGYVCVCVVLGVCVCVCVCGVGCVCGVCVCGVCVWVEFYSENTMHFISRVVSNLSECFHGDG